MKKKAFEKKIEEVLNKRAEEQGINLNSIEDNQTYAERPSHWSWDDSYRHTYQRGQGLYEQMKNTKKYSVPSDTSSGDIPVEKEEENIKSEEPVKSPLGHMNDFQSILLAELKRSRKKNMSRELLESMYREQQLKANPLTPDEVHDDAKLPSGSKPSNRIWLEDVPSVMNVEDERDPEFEDEDGYEPEDDSEYFRSYRSKPAPTPTDENEEVIVNIAELADKYATLELEASIPNFTIENFKEDYERAYLKHFNLISSFKRNNNG